MKKYIKRRIIISFETVILLIFIFSIKNENVVKTELTVAMNDSNNRVLEKRIIEKSQNNLYQKSIEDPESLYKFNGELTGYSGDCPLCSGYLACPPRTNVLKSGIYFDDKTYGKIRIVASSKNYPCGTILKFKVNKISKDPIIAIVLDRGVSGNTIDLLTDSEASALKNIGRVKNLNFEVLREGWK